MKKITDICQYCNIKKPLCSAHIIPRWCHVETDGYCKINLKTKNEISKNKTPSKGEYDLGILCEDCDNGPISTFDNMGAKFYKSFKSTYVNSSGYKEVNFSGEEIMLFLISLIWRSSISKRFKEISLGPLESEFMNIMKRKVIPEKFQCFAFEYDSRGLKNKTNIDFNGTISIGRNSLPIHGYEYIVLIDGVQFHLKISKSSFNKHWNDIIFNANDSKIKVPMKALEDTPLWQQVYRQISTGKLVK